MRRSTYVLLWQAAIILLVTCYVMLCTGCYGPAYMTSNRDRFNDRMPRRGLPCDAYHGIQFDNTDTIIVNTLFSIHPSNTVLTK